MRAMQPLFRRGNCARCSLRQHISVLQQRRHRSSRDDPPPSPSTPIRYHWSDGIDHAATLTFENIEGSSFIRRASPAGPSAFPRWGLDEKSQNLRHDEHFREALSRSLTKVEQDVRNAPLLKQLAKDQAKAELGTTSSDLDVSGFDALLENSRGLEEIFGDTRANKSVSERNDALLENSRGLREIFDDTRANKSVSERNDAFFESMWESFVDDVFEGDPQQQKTKRKKRQHPEAGKGGREGREGRGNRGAQVETEDRSQLWHDLRDIHHLRGQNGLEDRLKFIFYGRVTSSRFTASDVEHQKILADLRYPAEWFPGTRTLQREVHLHVGPTNSGKTYHALKKLEQAATGAYAGPLRLLAHEVYTRMNAKGKPCALITGEERRAMAVTATDPEEQPSIEGTGAGAAAPASGTYQYDMMACTVEMMPLNKSMEVAVIDEIQMIGSPERGWAWTQAVLGVMAKEVHLCGEERTVPLIKELCASVGEKLTIHHYQRLSPLMVADQPLNGDLTKLRKGDCIVSFSVMGIHALRKQIERQTGRKVATVYGSLPPETRAQQARLFNDPDNDYDFLVASDAVGMGLNLAIKRVIFESANKFDGVTRRTLSVADIKQIGGRAGRFRIANQVDEKHVDVDVRQQDLAAAKGETSPPRKVAEEVINPIASPSTSPKSRSRTPPANKHDETYRMPPSGDVPDGVGIVTTLERFDYPIVRAAMNAQPEPIKTAGLFPPGAVLERFSSYFPPGTPFSYILTRLHELSQIHSRFHLCGLKEQVWIADLIEPVAGLTITDRNIISSAPAGKSDGELWQTLLPELARAIASQKGGGFLDIQSLPLEILDEPMSLKRTYLRGLERLHKGIVSYLWLSYRFHGIFTGRAVAGYVKGLVEDKIEEVLKRFSFEEAERRKMVRDREREFLRGLEEFNLGGDFTEEKGAEGMGLLGGEAEDVVFEEDGVIPEVDGKADDVDGKDDIVGDGDGKGVVADEVDGKDDVAVAGGERKDGAVDDDEDREKVMKAASGV